MLSACQVIIIYGTSLPVNDPMRAAGDLGELPRAYVVLKPGKTLTAAQVHGSSAVIS